MAFETEKEHLEKYGIDREYTAAFDARQAEYIEQARQLAEQELDASIKRGRYTLEQAAAYLSRHARVTETQALADLMTAVRAGALRVYATGADAPHTAQIVRPFFDHVIAKDINVWLEANYPLIGGIFPAPESGLQAVKQSANTNEASVSGLLKAPARQDNWFPVIDDMAREFYSQFGEMPKDVQAWGRLWESPPKGYAITTGKDKGGEDCLKMPGCRPLSRGAFKKRWKEYTADKTE
jgi:hypothetical protein